MVASNVEGKENESPFLELWRRGGAIQGGKKGGKCTQDGFRLQPSGKQRKLTFKGKRR